MIPLYEKSINTLELPAVLQSLAACAVSAEAKEQCRKLLPVNDPDDVRELQEQTSAACRLVTLKGTPGFADVKEVAMSLDRADRGGCLTTTELLRIAGVLRSARLVKAYADGTESTCLDSLFFDLTGNRYLEDRITGSILSEDEISDSASPELADIRRHMRVQSARVKDSLQKIISSPAYSKYLREPIITLRSDRYVVPVKSEYKNEIPGLIHDVSSSGGTFFVEPMSVVNANNALRELLLKEQKEIERILAEFSAEAASHRENIERDYRTLITLDVIFAKARLSFDMKACPPEIRTDGSLELKRARHPLIDRKTVVPISVRLGSDFDTMVITGPNTGGKTVSLKTIGLLTLMAECGLHIPADDGSYISVFETVLADIGDEQSIEQSLSTFSSHMKNIVEIVEICDKDSLVLFDELGAGTDPAEGAALAIAIIEFCRKMGARVAATTHYAELKVYAICTDGVINASCEFDVETLQPTYKLLIGIPGKSNAFAISRRLGLDEQIIESAKSTVNENDRDFEDVLNQLDAQRQQMEQAKIEAERMRLEMEKTKQKSDEYYQQIKKEHDRAVEIARKDAKEILDDARRTANQVYDELKILRKQVQDSVDAQNVNERQAELRRSLNEAEKKLYDGKEPQKRAEPSRPVQTGDTVELLSHGGTRGTVLSIAEDGTLTLQMGIMKVKAKPDEVALVETNEQKQRKAAKESTRSFQTATVSSEVDLRGMNAEEAISVLSLFLDNAWRGHLQTVRIIHGKGTGVLRKAVHQYLKNEKNVKNYRLGVYGEGEDGVTIADFR
ncbi:MAG: endonuclease MutS2 [Oscillospiraceae bacterium]|nr:endonuclease MutS2 [Oscillospiraceae bacterium]